MVLRGLPRALGIDMSRRSTYGEIIPLRLVMGGDPSDFTGPAIARIVDQVEGINTALERGDGSIEKVLGVAQNLIPVALGNMTRTLFNEPSSGTLTRRGQQLLPAGALSPFASMASFMGFTPTEVARERDRRGLENYYNYRSKNGKDMYTTRMAISLGNYIQFMRQGKIGPAMDNYRRFLKDYLHVSNHDLANQAYPSRQYNINPKTPLNRAIRAVYGQGTGPRVRKAVRPEILRGVQQGSIPPSQKQP